MSTLRSRKMGDEAPCCWQSIDQIGAIATALGPMAAMTYVGLSICQTRYHKYQWFPATPEYLTTITGVSRTSVKRMLQSLIDEGFVKKKSGKGQGGVWGNRTNSFALTTTGQRFRVTPIDTVHSDPIHNGPQGPHIGPQIRSAEDHKVEPPLTGGVTTLRKEDGKNVTESGRLRSPRPVSPKWEDFDNDHFKFSDAIVAYQAAVAEWRKPTKGKDND